MTVTVGQPLNLANLLAPSSGGTSALPFLLSLTGGTAEAIEWTAIQMSYGMMVPQSVRIDNSGNNSAVTFTEKITGWTRRVPAGWDRTFQFPAVTNPKFEFSSSGSITLMVYFLDWPAFPDVAWNGTTPSVEGMPVAIVNTPSVVLSGNVVPPPAPVTYAVATTTTITAGGTSQTLYAAGVITTEAILKNPDNAAEYLFIDPTGAACGTIETGSCFGLAPGASFNLGPAANAVTVNAATTGHAFSSVRY